MPTYRVIALVHTTDTYEVDAVNEDEAREKVIQQKATLIGSDPNHFLVYPYQLTVRERPRR